jgi:hypothetical protein
MTDMQKTMTDILKEIKDMKEILKNVLQAQISFLVMLSGFKNRLF